VRTYVLLWITSAAMTALMIVTSPADGGLYETIHYTAFAAALAAVLGMYYVIGKGRN